MIKTSLSLLALTAAVAALAGTGAAFLGVALPTAFNPGRLAEWFVSAFVLLLWAMDYAPRGNSPAKENRSSRPTRSDTASHPLAA